MTRDSHIPPPPTGPDESRAIPPHGPVSPDGSAPWPRPSPAARAVVYGGVALAVAGLTLGTVMLGRKLLASDKPPAPARLAEAPPLTAPRPTPRRHASGIADLSNSIRDASALFGTVLAATRTLADHSGELNDQFRKVSDLWRPPAGSGKESAAPGRDGFPDDTNERLHRL